MVEGELSIAIATAIFQNIDAILVTKGESSKGHLPALLYMLYWAITIRCYCQKLTGTPDLGLTLSLQTWAVSDR